MYSYNTQQIHNPIKEIVFRPRCKQTIDDGPRSNLFVQRPDVQIQLELFQLCVFTSLCRWDYYESMLFSFNAIFYLMQTSVTIINNLSFNLCVG